MLSLDCAPTSLSSCSSVLSHLLFWTRSSFLKPEELLSLLTWKRKHQNQWSCPIYLFCSAACKTLCKVAAAREKKIHVFQNPLPCGSGHSGNLIHAGTSQHSFPNTRQGMTFFYDFPAPLLGLALWCYVAKRGFFPCTSHSCKLSNHTGVLNWSTWRYLLLAQGPLFSSFQEE